MSPPQTSFKQYFSFDRLVSVAYLLGLLIFAYRFMRPLLFRSWFFSSDEYVFAAEVIRFSSFNFHQFFFDNPGTPFMILDAALWSLLYWAGRVVGWVPPGVAMSAFNYQHIPLLFAVMRATTLAFFLASCVLLFQLCARLVNRPAAAIAALLLAMSPMYVYYSSFVRTESLAMTLMLGALLCLHRGIARAPEDWDRPPGLRDYATLAGLMAGVAGGARLHSMTAVLPVIALTLWLGKPYLQLDYPIWLRRWSRYAVPALLLGSAALWFLLRITLATNWPAAVRLLSAVAYLIAGGTCSALLLYRYPPTRARLVRVLSPDHLKVAFGFGVGLAVGNPFTVMQRDHFFQSLQLYSGYLDLDRASWPFWKNLTWYVRHYMEIVAPDTLTLALLALGGLAILAARDRKLLPYLIGAALFFVSKPINIVASSHHIILWLPFFFIVCAYPVGKLFALARTNVPHSGFWAGLLLVCLWIFAVRHLTIGPSLTHTNAMLTEGRMHSIEQATSWIKKNTEPDAFVAVSYYCFNSDTFFVWLAGQQVPTPREALDGRHYDIWWGNASHLRGRAGYACATHNDVLALKIKLDLAQPGEGTDPFHDPHFQEVAAFGKGEDEVNLFRFDYR